MCVYSDTEQQELGAPVQCTASPAPGYFRLTCSITVFFPDMDAKMNFVVLRLQKVLVCVSKVTFYSLSTYWYCVLAEDQRNTIYSCVVL